MYEEHPTFIEPDDENVKVWRYLDFTKFISLIDTQSLYFTRADKFNDPYEGSYPIMNVKARNVISSELPEWLHESLPILNKNTSRINKIWPRFIALNCWHENEYESAAMWNLYLKSNEGIAIQSTFKQLKKSIIDNEKVYIGKVKYIDYDKEIINDGNLFEPFVHKRKSFEHEREIRALIMKWPIESDIIHVGNGTLNFSKNTIKDGLYIKVDIKSLIQKINIAPNAPKWFSGLVKEVVKRYGCKFEVIHSQLDKSPLF